MAFISWIVELVAGWATLLIRFFLSSTLNGHITEWITFAVICVNFIIIPCTYILNNGATKEVIVSENWREGLRNILHLRGDAAQNVPPVNAPRGPGQNRSNSNARGPANLQQNQNEAPMELEDIEEVEEAAPVD